MSIWLNEKLWFQSFPQLPYAVTEALNTLWTNLSYSGKDMKAIAFTSCHPNEGKSFTVMNLARIIAGTGKSVLVVDADLRKSVLAGRYRISNPMGPIRGLAHYLAGQCQLEDIVYASNVQGLNLLLAGHEVLNSFALLNSPLFPNMMENLRKQFDVLLVDTPPVGTIIDAAIVSRSCDGTVLVVKENDVSRRELLEIRKQIEKVGGRVLGTVLNDVVFNQHGLKKYYYKAYYKYSSSDNAYYGAGNVRGRKK